MSGETRFQGHRFRYAAALDALLLLVMFAPNPARAGARDDVLSAAFHCAGIVDTRHWLDCYYGAAQPMRAQLGLEPAPTWQSDLNISLQPGGVVSDMGVREQVMANASTCYTSTNDRQWLNCYYAAAVPIRVQLGLSSGSSAVALPETGPALIGKTITPHTDTNNVLSQMVAYKFNQYGIFTVTLANGQVWQQLSGDTTFASWKKPPAAYVVQITPGFLGSHNLHIRGIAGTFKVQQLE